MNADETIRRGSFVEAQAGERLDRALAAALPELSRERLKALIAEGQVALDGAPAGRASLRVAAGQAYAVTLPPVRTLDTAPEAIALDIAYEDAHLIVIDKPAGMVVHPAAGHAGGTLVNALLHHCAGQLSGIGGTARPGIVHRIDKDTSGLLVVAKSDAAHEGLAAQFAAHSIERRYVAIVQGQPTPPAGTITGAIGRSSHDRKKMAIVAGHRGKPATTHYAVTETLGTLAARVECRLETGRTHQIRVHMASIGHSLLGDPLYGRMRGGVNKILKELDFNRQALHAERLGFVHPVTGKKLLFESPISTDMMELMVRLRV